MTFHEFLGYMIIGICVFEALLIIIGVIIVKRFRSRASKDRIPRKRLADTDGLVTPSTDKGAEIAYELMPLECVLPSNVNENVKDVYAECPDNVYDSTLIRRPYVFQQNNIYQTNEGNYNASFSKRDRDINNDSNLYQSCD
ncbi:uncharacterized protein LOC133202739 [Saccostrea echinata]|uniref:uncharacterized protein LOC133202739 n=1 Tax=Saccostrea echinata TaxID=191078 RepID=UPI002A7F9690|nr:uncharacterized protein LOC133202739 [Saccostrea echinata]